MKKILKYPLIFLLLILIGSCIALQTPYIQKKIAETAMQRLGEATDSQVLVDSYDGFFPFHFVFYHMKFVRNKEVWLEIDRADFHQTFLTSLLKNRKGIHLSLSGVDLLQIPETSSSTPFHFPKFPYPKLSADIRIKNFTCRSTVEGKEIPPANAQIFLRWFRKGSLLTTQASLSFPSLAKSSLKGSFRIGGKKFTSTLQIKDPGNTLLPYFFSSEAPPFEGELSARGTEQSLASLFHPEIATEEGIEGALSFSFPADRKRKEGARPSFLSEKNLEGKASFSFFSRQGLFINRIDVDYAPLSLTGQLGLSREGFFKDTDLRLHVSSLEKLNIPVSKPLSGEGEMALRIEGYRKEPILTGSLHAEKITYGLNEIRDWNALITRQKIKDAYRGSIRSAGLLNRHKANFQGNFSYETLSDLSFADLSADYADNRLRAEELSLRDKILFGTIFFRIPDAALLSPLIGKECHGDFSGESTLDEVRLSGKPRQEIALQVFGKSFRFDEIDCHIFSFFGKGSCLPLQPRSFEGDLSIESEELMAFDRSWPDIRCNGYLKDRALSFHWESSGDFSILSSGLIQREEKETLLSIRSFSGTSEGIPYKLLSPTTFLFSEGSFTNSPLLLEVGAGTLSFTESQDFSELIARNFPVPVLHFFIPYLHPSGTVDLQASLRKEKNIPTGTLTCSFNRLFADQNVPEPPYRGNLQLTLEKHRLTGSLRAQQTPSKKMETSFDLPITVEMNPFRVILPKNESARIDLLYKGSALNPLFRFLIPQNHLLGGNIDMDISLHGHLKRPKITGSIRLRKGSYENLHIGLSLKNMDAYLVGEGETLRLRSFQAGDGLNGTITARGQITPDIEKKLPFFLDASVERARLLETDSLSATFSGPVSFRGNSEKAVLSGSPEVLKAEAFIPNASSRVMPVFPVTYVYPRKKEAPPSRTDHELPVTFDLHLSIPGHAYIRGRGIESLWKGNLHITGTDKAPELYGELENINGTFSFAGNSLRFKEGKILFHGDLLTQSRLHVTAETDIRHITVRADLKGPPEDLRLTFSSSPPYPTAEIISLMLYNETVKKLTPFQAVALTHTLATLSGAYTGPGVIDRLRNGIGVDQLSFGSSVGQNQGDYTTIQIGKYFTRNILITLDRPITPGMAPFLITAHFKRNFELQTAFSEEYLLSTLSLRWKLSY